MNSAVGLFAHKRMAHVHMLHTRNWRKKMKKKKKLSDAQVHKHDTQRYRCAVTVIIISTQKILTLFSILFTILFALRFFRCFLSNWMGSVRPHQNRLNHTHSRTHKKLINIFQLESCTEFVQINFSFRLRLFCVVDDDHSRVQSEQKYLLIENGNRTHRMWSKYWYSRRKSIYCWINWFIFFTLFVRCSFIYLRLFFSVFFFVVVVDFLVQTTLISVLLFRFVVATWAAAERHTRFEIKTKRHVLNANSYVMTLPAFTPCCNLRSLSLTLSPRTHRHSHTSHHTCPFFTWHTMVVSVDCVRKQCTAHRMSAAVISLAHEFSPSRAVFDSRETSWFINIMGLNTLAPPCTQQWQKQSSDDRTAHRLHCDRLPVSSGASIEHAVNFHRETTHH